MPIKSLNDIKAELAAEQKTRDAAERRGQKVRDRRNLAYVKDHRDSLVATILEPFERKVRTALQSRDQHITLTVYNDWGPAADWLASEVVKELAGYSTTVERIRNEDVRYSDETPPETVYYTAVKVILT